MSKAFEEISAGLGNAIQHAKGKKSKVVVHKPETINVQAIQKNWNEPAALLRNLWNIVGHLTSLGARTSSSERGCQGFA